MLTWICIGIAVQVGWLVVQFTQITWVTIHESFEMNKKHPWTVLIDLVVITINILIWPISLVTNLYIIYKFNKEKEEGL